MAPSLTSSRLRRAGTALVAVLSLASTALVAAPAEASQARHHGHRYLATGDSVPFAYRPPAVTPAGAYLDASTFRGYPGKAAHRLGLRLSNSSCPGETTASFIDATAQSNGCENSLGSPAGYRDSFPLHVAYAGSQLDYDVAFLRKHRSTRLVTLNIGANDLFLCQRTNADTCTGADFVALTARIERNVGTILSTLRDRGGYHHRLVVVSYYSLDYSDAATTNGISALNAALGRAARANDAGVADGFGAFREAAESSGGDACAAGLIIALPAGGCDVHPTKAGHRVLAHAVARAAGLRHWH